jgi:hypothetical protein
MAGVASGQGAPQYILDCFGVPLHNPQAVLQRFGEHFAKVLGVGRDISLSIWDFLDTLVYEVESSLGVEGEVYDEPSL